MAEKPTWNWTDRLLGLCPVAIAVLWVGGVTMFRGVVLAPIEWLTLLAAGFAVHVLTQRAFRRKPLPPMPEGARAVPLAGLVASIVAAAAGILGGILEAVANTIPSITSDVPWGLRTLWHAACAFGASYCAFLRRLLRVLPA